MRPVQQQLDVTFAMFISVLGQHEHQGSSSMGAAPPVMSVPTAGSQPVSAAGRLQQTWTIDCFTDPHVIRAKQKKPVWRAEGTIG